jgi:hypothetical protein
MGADGSILCRQAISSMATRMACWLVSCKDISSVLLSCFLITFCNFLTCPSNFCNLWQDYDSLLSSTHATIHSKVVDFQKELVTLQVWLYAVLSLNLLLEMWCFTMVQTYLAGFYNVLWLLTEVYSRIAIKTQLKILNNFCIWVILG